MTATTMYRVSGHCAHATVNAPTGRVRQLFFKGQLLPPDCPPAEIKHLLSVKLIEPIQVGAPAPAESGQPAEVGSDAELTDAVTATEDGAGSEQGGDGEPGAEDGTGAAGETSPDEQKPDADQAPPVEGADVEAQRAEARAKLEAAGGKPTGRHGQHVWVEYLVTKGYDYSAVAKADKAELVELANQLA